MEKYKVGQLSKVMGVTSHTIKHYEKFNLVVPVKDEENNYRYYDMRQCNRIIESKKYRNIGFPLKDISTIMNESNNEMLNAKLLEHSKILESQIAQLQEQYFFAQEYYQESMEMDQNLGQWYIEKCPAITFIKQTRNEQVITENTQQRIATEMMEQIPKTKPTLYIDGDSFYDSNTIFSWGLAQYGKYNVHNIGEESIIRDEFRGFVTYIKIAAPFIIKNNKLIDIINERYREFSYEKIKEAFLFQSKIVQEEDGEYHYFKVYIPLD